ncbi:hypothetical protein B4U84_29705 [Westiellopsis prolifica IICB1]|nr:hypothetical protein B4U84_29705 [Westiellopsis prolifica IICB1]
MQAAYCALSVSLNYFPKYSQLAVAKEHLETAIALSQQYLEVRNSIFWIKAKASTKRRIKQQLNELAFDAYSHMIELGKLLDDYADIQDSLNVNVPRDWRIFTHHLHYAFDLIKREHRKEVNYKQLTLNLTMNTKY